MSSSRRRKANKSNVSGPSSRTEFKTAIVGGSVPSVSSTRLTEFKTPESNIPVELKSNGSTGVQFPKWRTSEFSAPEYSRISPKIPARGSSRSSDAKKRKRSKISKDASEISKDNPKIVAPKSKSILASEKVENSLSVVNKGKPPLTRRDIPEPISLNLYAAPQTYNYNLRSDDPYKIVRLYIPILACLFLVLLSVMAIPYFRATFQLNDPSTLLPEDDADAPWLKQPPSYVILPEPTLILKSDSLELTDNPWFIILVIVVFLVMLVVCSISLLCLYKYEWYKTITALFILAFLVYLLAFPMVYIQELIYIANIPLDYFTLSFLLYNYVASGLIVLFVSGPKLMKQFYHVLTCAALALFLIKLLNEWMTVGLLIVMLLWDLYAVLHTQGKSFPLIYDSKSSSPSCRPTKQLAHITTEQGKFNATDSVSNVHLDAIGDA